MKNKLDILKNIQNHYSSYMKVWCFSKFGSSLFDFVNYQLISFEESKEEHHIIANAANKFYELLALNDSETKCFYESAGEIS